VVCSYSMIQYSLPTLPAYDSNEIRTASEVSEAPKMTWLSGTAVSKAQNIFCG
jgi:hypothetical protein